MRISDWSSDVCSSDLTGFEIGLASSITTHGLVGYGLMASSTLREGIAFGYKFLPTRLPYLRLDFHVDGHQAVVSVLDAADLGIVRNHAFEFFLVGVYRLLLQCSFGRLEEHKSELQSLMRISYAVFCLKKKNLVK